MGRSRRMLSSPRMLSRRISAKPRLSLEKADAKPMPGPGWRQTKGGKNTDGHGPPWTSTDRKQRPCSSVFVRVRPCSSVFFLPLPPLGLAGHGDEEDRHHVRAVEAAVG